MTEIDGVEAAAICVICAVIVFGAYAIGFELGRSYEARGSDNRINIGRLHIDNFSIDGSFGENNFVRLFLDGFVLENVILRGGGAR